MITMSIDDWETKYQPIQNPIDEHSSFDGAMFETYGDEDAYVRNQPLEHIWTYLDGEDDRTYIVQGYHIIGRIGYFITKIPIAVGEEFEIPVGGFN